MDFYSRFLFKTEIEIKNGVIEKATAGEDKLEIFREYAGGWAVSSKKEEVKKVLRLFGGGKLGPGKPGRGGRIKPIANPMDFSLEEKVAFFMEISKFLKEKGVKSNIRFRDFYVIEEVEVEGRNLKQEYPFFLASIDVVAKGNGKMESSFRVFGFMEGWEAREKVSLEEIEKAIEEAKEMLQAEKAEKGKFDVVLDNGFTGVLVHEAFGHAAEADHITAGASILSGKIGEKVASPLVTIVDSPLANGTGKYWFDRDGVAAQETVIVKNGILKSFLHNRETAGKLNSISTGNCRGKIGQVRMSNTFMLPGEMSKEELIEDVKEGYLFVGMRGGTTSPATGYFNFTPRVCYKIERGEIKEMIKGIALIGETLSTLKKIDAIGNDLKILPGSCGKGGEWIRVGVGGPHIRLREVIIG